jgi:hypothetical protein
MVLIRMVCGNSFLMKQIKLPSVLDYLTFLGDFVFLQKG